MTKDSLDILFGAMRAARKAFDDYIEKRGLDAAYWKLGELNGWVLSTDFEKMDKLTMNDDWVLEGDE
jgi:hypothetical protein